MSKKFTGLLVVAAVAVSIVVVATTGASPAGTAVVTAVPTLHPRAVESATAMKRAVATYRIARAKCDLFDAAEKSICDAEAKKEQKRAKSEARNKYKDDNGSAASPAMNPPVKTTRGLDLVFYRAHQQLDESTAGCFADTGPGSNGSPGKYFPRIAMN